MAANPRKFSEKIALMRAKEAEGDAAFHQILTEVSGITKTTETQMPPYTGLNNLIPHGNSLYAPYKAGSLPNINHSLQQQQMQQRQHSPSQGQMHSPHAASQSPQQTPANQMAGSTGIDLKSAINDLNSLNGGDVNRRRIQPTQYGNGGTPSMRPQRNRASDHAPYSPYLTPHPLSATDWKKFKSDSDIHGSVKHQTPSSSSEGSASSGLISPLIHRRVLEVGGNTNSPMPVGGALGVSSALGPLKPFPEGGAFSLNGVPPMPPPMGSSGLPPPHQMSLSNSGQHHGSLPDLSNLGFTSHSLNSNTSHGPCSPPSDGFGRIVSANMPPPDSPSSLRPSNGRHPSPFVGNSTQVQGIPQQFQYLPQPGLGMHPLAPAMAGPHPAHTAHLNNSNALSHNIPISQQAPKSPANLEKQLVNETIRRRISDKMLAQQQAQQYRQNTESVPSPSSPGTPPIRSPESVGGSSQHGENSMSFALSPGSHSSLQQQFDQVKMDGPSPHNMNSNHFANGNLTENPFIHEHRPPMKQHSIPNIVLTGVDDNYGQFFDKEFKPTMSMSDSFDANEMFVADEQFRSDLAPICLEDLRMLDDPSNVLTDPNTEEQLR
ncbi:CREB-regulated transcription coactivator 1-like isoform X2 [Watersipora subatra]|uniref:CREB-regulated transcription coactivator 1-like isoform X2 n=1 Tax=Watersipora subatra TaxID=2589382 RepID=UPI00355BA7CC